ncbi:MAG: TetR/AcrR family transcriptional regulator [Anaerolineae bacterium]|nr:TetR/AcrR family transcriptional regulator [Anaerolineae bacterium]
MRKKDRRVERTHKLLREALIILSLRKGYDSVTIQDITDHANLGRATFYLHYRDKDDLLLNTLQTIVDDLLAVIEPELGNVFTLGDISPILTIFRHAEENRDLYRIILRGRGAAAAERRLREYAAASAQSYIEVALHGRPAAIPVEIAANYFAHSMLGLIDWWLEKGQAYPADYMAHAFYDLGITSVIKTLGLDVDIPAPEKME